MDNKTVALEVAKGMRPEKPDDCPEDVFNIMQQCWKADPDERPSFKTLVNSFMKMRSDVPDENKQVDNVGNYDSNLYN